MQQEPTSPPPAPWAFPPVPKRYWPSRWAWAGYFFTLALALFCPFFDAAHNRTPDTHPLQIDRLCLRVVGILFMVANFTIAGVVGFRMWRFTTRLRKGMCLTCGYDLRAHSGGDRCPECGRPFERSDPDARYPLTRGQRLIFKAINAGESGWVNLVWAIACVAAALYTDSGVASIIFFIIAAWFLYFAIRRHRNPAGGLVISDDGRVWTEEDLVQQADRKR